MRTKERRSLLRAIYGTPAVVSCVMGLSICYSTGSVAAGYFSIESEVQSGKCLDLPNGSTADGTKLQLYTCHPQNGQNQTWLTLTDSPNLNTIINGRSSNVCMDLPDDGSGIAVNDGTPIQAFHCHGSVNQEWVLVPFAAGGSLIVSARSGKCLDVAGASTADGAKVQQYTCHGGANQRWTVSYVPLIH